MMILCTSAKLRLKKWSSLFIILPRAIEHSYSGSMTQNMESAHPVRSNFVPRLLGLAYDPAQSQSKSFVLLFKSKPEHQIKVSEHYTLKTIVIPHQENTNDSVLATGGGGGGGTGTLHIKLCSCTRTLHCKK